MPILGLSPEWNIQAPYPKHFDIEKVIRPNILALHPYRCARDDYQSGILLDANENSLGHSIPSSSSSSKTNGTNTSDDNPEFLVPDLHRYPDPSHDQIKDRIASLRNIKGGRSHVFLGVGSDEVIDLLMRVCVAPVREKILITPPTYGMYSVCAGVNDLPVVRVQLDVEGGAFQPQVDEIRKAVSADPSIRLIFLCSPGNPTGTLIPISTIVEVLEIPDFNGIVIVDEAYIDFSPHEASAVTLVEKYSNLCVMQTLSKSFGLASIRLGIAIAQPPLIQILTNTKAPYNVAGPSAAIALKALAPEGIAKMRRNVEILKASRTSLLQVLSSPEFVDLGVGKALGGNEANFIVLPILDKKGGVPDNTRAQKLYIRLAEECGVVVRYRGGEPGCKGCLRVTVGTEEENKSLIEMLKESLQVL